MTQSFDNIPVLNTILKLLYRYKLTYRPKKKAEFFNKGIRNIRQWYIAIISEQ